MVFRLEGWQVLDSRGPSALQLALEQQQGPWSRCSWWLRMPKVMWGRGRDWSSLGSQKAGL
jgi:hypothetical protein